MAVALNVIHQIAARGPYAVARNAVFIVWFLVLAPVPVSCFHRRPAQMFSAVLVAWAIFVVGYDDWKQLVGALHHGPLLLLVEGAILYAICALGSWAVPMTAHARRHSITPVRHAACVAARHSR